MLLNSDLLFRELRYCLSLPVERHGEGYAWLHSILTRLVKELAGTRRMESFGTEAQLIRICRIFDLPYANMMQLYRKACTWQHEEGLSDAQTYAKDMALMMRLVAAVFLTDLPEELVALQYEDLTPTAFLPCDKMKKLRMVVTHWDNDFVYGLLPEYSDQGLYKMRASADAADRYRDVRPFLFEGAQINLLDVEVHESRKLVANYVVVEPDYLIDVSTLAAAIRSYGAHPLNYLLRRFSPLSVTSPILLGNAANQFMDDCFYEADAAGEEELYLKSVRKSFQTMPLSYVCSRQPIEKPFFDEARNQFKNIYSDINASFGSKDKLRPQEVLLEPSFICEALGLRGRMDMLATDGSILVELKSGKAEMRGQEVSSVREHRIQALLYKEALYHNQNVPRDKHRAYLYYSKYPALVEVKDENEEISLALWCRNRIVHFERQLKNGRTEFLFNSLRWDILNENRQTGRFVEQYLRPSVEEMLKTLTVCSDLEREYFTAFLSFVEREQFYAKICDNNVGSTRGFANVWRLSTQEKLLAGDIITGLRINEVVGDRCVEKLVMKMPVRDNFVPNFRKGEMVQFYIYNNVSCNVTNQQITRAYIEDIGTSEITLTLAYKQRNVTFFDTQHTYAIEHEHSDTPFTQMLRNLYAFLRAPLDRRELLLCQRLPRRDKTRQLCLNHGLTQINNIVLKAKQAKDYFLLVGPPGTGKTSVVLKAMVEEFLETHKEDGENILLLAYTNRAVDEICEMLASINPAPRYIRLGQPQTCEKKYQPYHISNVMADVKSRKEVLHTVQQCHIWVSTLSTMTGQAELFGIKRFACAIIDEASQVIEPQLLGLLSAVHQDRAAIDKFILIGDHHQLPAVVVQSVEESAVKSKSLRQIYLDNLRQSLFERLTNYLCHHEQGDTTAHFIDELHRQGRMHEEICAFPSKAFYGNKLCVIDEDRQKRKLPYAIRGDEFSEFVGTTRFGFINVNAFYTGTNHKLNPAEAEVVAQTVKEIIRLHRQNGLKLDIGRQIGIIVPFRNQIALVRKELAALNEAGTEGITVDTVECYQGSQRDVIIFTTTISQRYQLDMLCAPHEGIDRKLNVAITRAREQLFVVGHATLLAEKEVYKQLIEHSKLYMWNKSFNNNIEREV